MVPEPLSHVSSTAWAASRRRSYEAIDCLSISWQISRSVFDSLVVDSLMGIPVHSSDMAPSNGT